MSPLVSVLIPTHNRPDYVELALKSVIAQSYKNIEIVISDNSDLEETNIRLQPYLRENSNIVYSRIPSATVMQNGANCQRLAKGEYLSWLMDDDLFHPIKIETMMHHMQSMANVGLVTSFRQCINHDGTEIDNKNPAYALLFNEPTIIDGRSLGRAVLLRDSNIIGEPSAILYKKEYFQNGFGHYLGRQYTTISDMASGLQILKQANCVYLPLALTFIRVHENQDQRQVSTQITGLIEGLQLLLDSYEDRIFMQPDTVTKQCIESRIFRATDLIFKLKAHHELSKDEVERFQTLISRGMAIILSNSK
jgi:glycosyltransferase involved in cell wall biosynthesis